jgi:hypothetical protein
MWVIFDDVTLAICMDLAMSPATCLQCWLVGVSSCHYSLIVVISTIFWLLFFTVKLLIVWGVMRNNVVQLGVLICRTAAL